MSHDVVAQAETGQNVAYTGSLQEFVTMRVGGQLFGISVLSVQDVLRKQRIAKIPLAPAVIAGSLNLRGRIVTVINMRRRLSLPPAEDDSTMMNVVVDYNNELFSLNVDSVGEVLSLPLEKFEKSPVNLSENWKEVAAGVFKLDKELLVILDADNLIKINS